MNKVCPQISLAVAVLLVSSQLGFAVPQNGPATNGLATNGLATGAGAESSPVPPASSYPDAPSAVKPPGAPDNGAEQAGFRAPAPAATGGLSRAIDGKYMVVMGAMFAFSIVNVEKTNTCLEQHTCSFVPVAFRSRGALYGAGNCGMPSHSLSREIPCDWSRNPAVGLRDPIDARARRRRQGSLEVLPGVLGRAVGDEENVVVPHGQIRFFGTEDLLQVNRYFLAALRSGADEPGRSPRRRRVGALGQRAGGA